MLTIAEAQAVVDDLESAMARWAAEAAARTAEAAELEARAGSVLLDDPQAGEQLAAEIASLFSTARMAQAAADEASRRLEGEPAVDDDAPLTGARRLLLWAQAQEVRAVEARVRAEIATRMKKTNRLLAGLQQHENVEFGVRLVPNPLGVGSGHYPWTRSQVLDAQAEDLKLLALQLENQARHAPEMTATALSGHMGAVEARLAAVG